MEDKKTFKKINTQYFTDRFILSIFADFKKINFKQKQVNAYYSTIS